VLSKVDIEIKDHKIFKVEKQPASLEVRLFLFLADVLKTIFSIILLFLEAPLRCPLISSFLFSKE